MLVRGGVGGEAGWIDAGRRLRREGWSSWVKGHSKAAAGEMEKLEKI